MRRLFSLAVLGMLAAAVDAQENTGGSLQVSGTVRAKYEYEPEIEAGRFEVRNARVAIAGAVLPYVGYKAEIDLSDEGVIKMLDAYVRLAPVDDWSLTLGQMRVPFTIDAHRSPHQQYFANRSFIAKQVGNVRDVGLVLAYRTGGGVPVTLEGGLFNGSGLTNQKDYWTRTLNFSVKAQAMITRCWNLTLSCQKIRPGNIDIYLYDAGMYYQTGRWHVEGEYLRKTYAGNAFRAVDAIDLFACCRIPLKKVFSDVSVLGRYDYMSDHSSGVAGDAGQLVCDDPARHRFTGGLTLGLGRKPFQTDLRINYEKYLYKSGAVPSVSEQDKIVVELMCRF